MGLTPSFVTQDRPHTAVQEEVDLLENYVLAHGIRGAAGLTTGPGLCRRLTLEEDREASAAELVELDRINSLRKRPRSPGRFLPGGRSGRRRARK